MTSTVDNTASPRSAKVIPSFSSPLSHVGCENHEPDGGCGDDAAFPPSLLASVPARSPRKPFVETQKPRSSEGSEHGGSGNASDASPIYRGKKPAWKVPSNGAIEMESVMDAISWPALTLSARALPKSPSSDSIKSLSDGSLCAPQGSLSSPSSNNLSDTQYLYSTSNSLTSPVKTMKGSPGSNYNSISGAAIVGPGMPASSAVPIELSQPAHTKQPYLENFPRAPPNQSSGNSDNERDHKTGRIFPQPHVVNEHQQGYGGGPRGSNGNRNNYGNRRDGERGGSEWNHRNFGRDLHKQHQLHQQQGIRPYLRPSVAAAPFITPPHLRPFANHMGFPDFPSLYFVASPSHPEPLRGVPFAPHPANIPQVLLFPAADPQRAMLLRQIDYYFSPENLCKDIFLRQNMDEQGWVPVSMIANFNRVKQMTNSIQYIVDTVQLSSVVEVQGDKIRRRNDWMSWVLNPVEDFTSTMALPSTNFDDLEDQFDNFYLDTDAPNNTGFRGSAKNEMAFSRSASLNLNSQLSVRRTEDDEGQVGRYSNRVQNMRTLVRNDTM